MDSQTYAQPRVTLRCQQCGHEWKGRSSTGTARQCSKCRSRQIVEVTDDDSAPTNALTIVPDESVNQVAVVPSSLMDDPDIRQKRKELELAKLDKQLMDLNGESGYARIIERLTLNHIELINELHGANVIDLNTRNVLISSCPGCGAFGKKGLKYRKRTKRAGISAGVAGVGYNTEMLQH